MRFGSKSGAMKTINFSILVGLVLLAFAAGCSSSFDPNSATIKILSMPQEIPDREKSVAVLEKEIAGHEQEALKLYEDTQSIFLVSAMDQAFAKNNSQIVSDYVQKCLVSPDALKVSRALGILRWRKLEQSDKEALDRVFALASNPDQDIRNSAIAVIARQGSTKSRDVVRSSLTSASNSEKMKLLLVISNSEDKLLLDIVQAHLKNADPQVRTTVVFTMIKLDPEKAIPILKKYRDPSAEVNRDIEYQIRNHAL